MESGFLLRRKGKIHYLTIPPFDKTGIVDHCFTTRLGGVSEGVYSQLNLGFKRGDDQQKVLKNYELICSAIGINYKDLVCSDQIHGDKVYVATEKDKGKGIVRESDIIGVDALITNKPGVPLITYYADCVPIFILDPVKKAIGLCHAGWRGTVQKIGQKTILKMEQVFETRPSDCLVGIGPSIGQCCYEVDAPVIARLKESFSNWREMVIEKSEGKWNLDLWKANKYQLEEIGVVESNITVSGLCTSCRNDLFYSYRKEKGVTGSLAAIIQLKKYNK
ncbi:MAG: purine-nucleoside/S-methyl-5-thioadenosine phosphorylase / adenosine deaminase [Thermosediminibacterales bacterium]|nr:purine-nucleoside/S-methyl-5-thioadenosine phosphorylase / adenosine deaminase [Thermosediminibacterales bacterium]MDK2836781.1 purine-nucleoside/S-methyl-5-thioadenosine phosphorylase / adenosine deaminase [Thermosediminibacterales bacterium]